MGIQMVAEDVSKRSFISESEAQPRFDELMARVKRGETISITQDGRVVAELSPGSQRRFEERGRSKALSEFLEEKATWPPMNVTREEILAWRHEGHRW